jgi:hypothetical protein
MTENQKALYVERVKKMTTAFVDALREADALKQQWTAQDLANVLVDGDVPGSMTVAELSAVVNTSLPAIDTFIETNFHYTNLYKVYGDV